MTWTKKHDEFCLKQKLRPSTRVLLSYIIRRSDKTQISEIEFDLRAFNIWVKKSRGTGYDRKTLKFAINQLDECTDGLILISKSYTWAVHKIIVRPLAFVLSENSQKKAKTPKLPTGEPMFDADRKKSAYKQQQQDISKLDLILRKVGLIYDPDALNRVWQLSGRKIDSVVSAVELLLHRHSTQTKKIDNPQGWLINCLKKGLAEGFDLYYQADLPYFKTGEAIANFVRDAVNTPAPATQLSY